VYRLAVEHYKEIFGVLAPLQKKLGPENYLFSTTLQVSGNFEGQYLQQGVPTSISHSVTNFTSIKEVLLFLPVSIRLLLVGGIIFMKPCSIMGYCCGSNRLNFGS